MFTEFTELIPGLPEEIALECLIRLDYSTHSLAAGVSRRWRNLLLSKAYYYHRKRTGKTRKAACLVQSLPVQAESEGRKPTATQPNYGISLFDPLSRSWDRIEPIPKYPDGLPLFCQVTSSEGKLVVLGGWDPASWEPTRDVFVYEFTTRRWSQRKPMPSNRSFFAAGAIGGRVFVAGGHDENKNALKSVCAYDIQTDEWADLNPMFEERDECQGIIIGSGFCVVSGYDTETQGGFKSSAEYLDIESGQWTRMEDAWRASQCPRSCVGVGTEGDLVCYVGSDPNVRVGVCGVELGDRILVTGSAYQGGPQGFFLLEGKQNEGQDGKFHKVEVPDEFSSFVQSCCCVEI